MQEKDKVEVFVPGVVPSEELAMVLASAEIDMTRTELLPLSRLRMVESCYGQGWH